MGKLTAAQENEITPAQIDEFINENMKKAIIPGLSLSIIQNNSVYYSRGYGKTGNGSVVSIDTPMMIGSVSKSFTAVAILKLNESGKIHLDKPIIHYIPWFRTKSEEWTPLITVRHCLHHLSGFSTIAGNRREFNTMNLETMVQNLNKFSLNNKPGTTYEYSNINYRILGFLIQIRSNMTYFEFIKTNILNPLNMDDTFLNQTEASQNGLKSGYKTWFGFPVKSNERYNPYYAPSGGIISTAKDMTKYVISHLNCGKYENIQLLSNKSIKIGHSLPEGVNDTIYAMGWYNVTENGKNIIAHGGDLQDFHADVVMIPEENIGIVVLININSYTGNLQGYNAIHQGILEILLDGNHNPSFISHRLIYVLIDLIVILSIIVNIRNIIIVPQKTDKLLKKYKNDSYTKRIWFKTLIDTFLPILILLGVPRIIGLFLGMPTLNLQIMATMQPDLVLWLIILVCLSEIKVIREIGYRYSQNLFINKQ